MQIQLDGLNARLDDFLSVRDHSFGVREWSYFDRYIWTIILLENGDFIHTSFIRYPVVKELCAGFIIRGGNEIISTITATKMDELPICGSVPSEFEFSVEYENGETKNIRSVLEYVVPFYFRGDFNVNEGICDFVVDGIRGRGVSEFGFNSDKARWTR